jgi:hypothetical protein
MRGGERSAASGQFLTAFGQKWATYASYQGENALLAIINVD